MPLRYSWSIPASAMRALVCMLCVWIIVPVSARARGTRRGRATLYTVT